MAEPSTVPEPSAVAAGWRRRQQLSAGEAQERGQAGPAALTVEAAVLWCWERAGHWGRAAAPVPRGVSGASCTGSAGLAVSSSSR